MENDDHTIGFCSLMNDKISVHESGSNRSFERSFKQIREKGKRLRSYPSMKIGRFGIHSDFQNKGYGGTLMDFLKIMFLNNNRTGCRFITVDAYNESLKFYQRNGFDFLTHLDEKDHTRLMFTDLLPAS